MWGTASLGIAKEICAVPEANPKHHHAMTAPEFEARLVAWARAQPGVEALVQIGSRVQVGATVDAWSDWDFQLIVRDPAPYLNRAWPAQIAPCWAAHLERTPRGVMKLSAIFAGGWETDFVILTAWQMKLVCFAMGHPGVHGWLPAALREGVHNLRLVACPGHRVVLGGPAWERRYAALAMAWPEQGFTADDFLFHTAGFWRHAVWTAKKIRRGELRAAQRWSHVELREHTYALLAEEARLEGRVPRPEARQAERWLDETRLGQTAALTGVTQRELAGALLAELILFCEVTASVAARRGWTVPDYVAVEAWLRTELAQDAG